MSRGSQSTKRPEKVSIKRAKVAISVAALTITVGGWLSMHMAESPDGSQPGQPSVSTSAPAGDRPAPVTSTRSSR